MLISVERGAFVRSFGTGPTLVCLHGFADNGTTYLPLEQTEAATRFTFVAPDLPGFGVSPMQSDVTSVDAFADWLNSFVREVDLFGTVGLVSHSASSLIAIRAMQKEPDLYAGLFSIEGNLTEADAYFSGQAADYRDAEAFKTALMGKVWIAGNQDEGSRRYYGNLALCDAEAMWHFGRDAKLLSKDAGKDFRELPLPTLYYWSRTSTPEATRGLIEKGGIEAREYLGGHTPTIEAPAETGEAIAAFFTLLYTRMTQELAAGGQVS